MIITIVGWSNSAAGKSLAAQGAGNDILVTGQKILFLHILTDFSNIPDPLALKCSNLCCRSELVSLALQD
jgi:hypothetical protein